MATAIVNRIMMKILSSMHSRYGDVSRREHGGTKTDRWRSNAKCYWQTRLFLTSLAGCIPARDHRVMVALLEDRLAGAG
jgi:hypothetical protein